MTSPSSILLGYEVPSGTPVCLDLKHTAIFGMTQSGKTTALEALITRSKLKAIAFIVKRGEAGFHVYNQILPYYKPRSDWQYVEGLLNVALREKVQYQPFMRWAILQVTKKHPANLREVLTRSEECEKEYPRRKEVFEQLSAYLRIVVPELEHQTFSTTLELQDGVNVMDLNDMTLEVQQIVIASTIECVFKTLDHVIVIIPEAWESLPQGKMTPIKWVAEQFVRKGAVLGNYMWLDSQDIGGIDKTPLRQCDNWILGRMKEAHEVERILKQLLGVKIQAKEIQTLPVGHFYCALGNTVKKVYVLPSNVPESVGMEVAKRSRSPESVQEYLQVTVSNGDLMYKEKFEESEKRTRELEGKIKQMEIEKQTSITQSYVEFKEETEKQIRELTQKQEQDLKDAEAKIANFEKKLEATEKLRDALKDLIGFDIKKGPSVNGSPVQEVNLASETVNYILSHSEKTIEISTTDQQGQILFVALNDLPRDGFTEKEMANALAERGYNIGHGSLAPHLNVNLIKKGLLVRVAAGPGTHKAVKYRLPTKISIKNKGDTETS
jgi:DNA segregation ATPase FtsK/SpoIIIE-like protein